MKPKEIKAALIRRDLYGALAEVCREHKVTIEDVLDGKRTKAVSRARTAFVHLCVTRYHFSHAETATLLGMNHSSVTVAVKRARSA